MPTFKTWPAELAAGYWAVANCTIRIKVLAELKGLHNSTRRDFQTRPIAANEARGLMRWTV